MTQYNFIFNICIFPVERTCTAIIHSLCTVLVPETIYAMHAHMRTFL